MKYVTFGLILLLDLAWFTTSPRACGSTSAEERFIAEYPEASKRLENYYKHVKIYFSKVTCRNGEAQDYEFFRSGGSIRLVQLAGKKDKPYYAYVADPDLIFRLKQDTSNGPFHVLDLGKGGPSDYKSWANLIFSKASLASAPYGAYLPGSVRDLLAEKTLRVKSVQEAADGTIHIDWEGVEPGLPRSRGTFSFLPDACWAIRDYSIRYLNRKDKLTKQALPDFNVDGHIDYAGSDNGVPVVHKLQTWMGLGDNRPPEFLFEVQDMIHAMVPKEEFTLASFAVRTRPAPPQVPIVYYLLALSAFCALMVLVVRFIRSRSERASTAT
jgi:hypothetical protein